MYPGVKAKCMLGEISWGNYAAGAGAILCCYYGFVGLGYYREELRAILQSGRKVTNDNTVTENTPAVSSEDNAAFEELEIKVSEINSILHDAGKEADKPVLLLQLSKVTANYDGLRKPAFKAAVFNHIIKSAKEICGVVISEAELEGIR